MICGSCCRRLLSYVWTGYRSEFQLTNSNAFSISSSWSNYTLRFIRSASIPQREVEARTPSKLKETSFAEFDKLLPKMLSIESSKPPTCSNSFADYVNFSETLQALVTLGVELHKIEARHTETMKHLVTLDLKRDIKPRIKFLLDHGVSHSEISKILTQNPKILDPDVGIGQMMEVINYLTENKFTQDERAYLITRLPTILTIPVADLDGILGFYQRLETNRSERKIKFSNDELKLLVLRCPMLIVSNLYAVYEQVRTLEVSCEFTLNQIRKLITGNPFILIAKERQLELLYKFYLREMGITNEEMTDFPGALTSRIQIVRERHMFLKYLGRAQYSRDKPGYIPLSGIFAGTDEQFCETLKLGTVQQFKNFIKKL